MQLVEKDLLSPKEKILLSDPEYDVSSVIIHPDTHIVQAASVLKARSEWTILDPAIEADLRNLKKLNNGDMFLINRDHADEHWLVGYTVDNGPIPYYLYDRSAGKGELLFTHRPELERYA